MKQARSLVLPFAALVVIPGILVWAALFFVINTVYFHYSEEKGLESRFGDEYLEYKKHVPMWLPRLAASEGAGAKKSKAGA